MTKQLMTMDKFHVEQMQILEERVEILESIIDGK